MKTCILCDEPITPADERAMMFVEPVHFECGVRAVAGGVNHQRGTCTCCGGTDDPDPPGMTRRQAAQAATDYLKRKNHDETL